MKTLALSAVAFAMIAASGATFAQSEVDAATLTCADFAAMSAEDQATALEALTTAMTEDGMDAADTTVETVVAACEGNDDMVAKEAVAAAM